MAVALLKATDKSNEIHLKDMKLNNLLFRSIFAMAFRVIDIEGR